MRAEIEQLRKENKKLKSDLAFKETMLDNVRAEYETEIGFRQQVVFPGGMILEPDGEVKIYYGASDTVECLATAKLDELNSWLDKYDEILTIIYTTDTTTAALRTDHAEHAPSLVGGLVGTAVRAAQEPNHRVQAPDPVSTCAAARVREHPFVHSGGVDDVCAAEAARDAPAL